MSGKTQKLYRVVRDFTEPKGSPNKDTDQPYLRGDLFPAEGCTATKTRIKSLLSTSNKIGKPVITTTSATRPVSSSKE